VKIFNTKTFEVTEFGDEYVELDPMIAETIALLNKKGYRTESSCEGHYPELTIADPEGEHEATIWGMEDLGFNPAQDCPYVDFAEGVELPDIPSGWTLEVYECGQVLCFDEGWDYIYTKEDFEKKQKAVLDSLHEWAEKL